MEKIKKFHREGVKTRRKNKKELNAEITEITEFCNILFLRALRELRVKKYFLRASAPSRLFLILFSLLFFAAPAIAADEAPKAAPAASTTYSPDTCQFSATFPGQPLIEHKCDAPGKCFDQVTYTKVFDMAATVSFKIICSPVDKDVYDTYSAEIMEKTLQAMTDRNVAKKFDSSFREEKELGYKQAGLVGEGQAGQLSSIYIAQLWIGMKSAFSVEAELIGEKNDDAEKMFSEILKSIHFVGDNKNAAKPGSDKPSEKDTPPKPDEKKPEAAQTPPRN